MGIKMHKFKHVEKIIFLILLITTVFVLISASSASVYEETKKIDSGKKIITVNNQKYQITWMSKQVIGNDKKYVDISYKSMKNKKNSGSLYIKLQKTGKNKIALEEKFSPMIVPNEKTIQTQVNTDKYYWKKLKPLIDKLATTSILNKETLKYNETRSYNGTFTDYTGQKIITIPYEMNWKVYYYNKTSSIEILKRYYNMDKKEFVAIFNDGNIRIDKFSKEKLRISMYPHSNKVPMDGDVIVSHKYVKTNLSPKQYYLQVYKNKLETEKLTNKIIYEN